MANEYNLYNLEASFKLFLISGNRAVRPISINNYLSDLRHFFGWIVLTIKNQQPEISLGSEDYEKIFSQFLTEEVIHDYMDYLGANNIPVKTINRRLSTLRKFCTFCITQGWIKTNPAKIIINVKEPQKAPKTQDNLTDFSDYLMKTEEDLTQAKTVVEDVKEFLVISSTN